jgi:hypothetical protein
VLTIHLRLKYNRMWENHKHTTRFLFFFGLIVGVNGSKLKITTTSGCVLRGSDVHWGCIYTQNEGLEFLSVRIESGRCQQIIRIILFFKLFRKCSILVRQVSSDYQCPNSIWWVPSIWYEGFHKYLRIVGGGGWARGWVLALRQKFIAAWLPTARGQQLWVEFAQDFVCKWASHQSRIRKGFKGQ